MGYLNSTQNYVGTWSDTLVVSLQNLWIKTISFLPEIIGALFILILGLIVASIFGKIAKKVFGYTKIDKLMDKTGISDELQKIGMKFSFTNLIGWIVKWFFIIATLIAVADILRIPQITKFLEEIVLYIPNVIVAVVILAIGLLAGKAVQHAVGKALKASSHLSESSTKLLTGIAKWAVVAFAVMAALIQLGIAASLIQILFTGLIAMLAIAGGLAFGLGGKEQAAKWLNRCCGKEDKF